MIYLLATVLGLVASAESLASEMIKGNIRHVQNGREPNAGACLFPIIPIVPLLFVGAMWVLQILIPNFAIPFLVGAFLIMSILWAISFARLKAELKQEISTRDNHDSAKS